MLDVKVDRADPTLLHDQVAAQIRRAIADGEARPGERLPPARDIAAVLGVNTNTVLRAMRLLRDEGLLEFRRGHGIRVAGTPQRSVVIAQARELLALARHDGYPGAEELDRDHRGAAVALQGRARPRGHRRRAGIGGALLKSPAARSCDRGGSSRR